LNVRIRNHTGSLNDCRDQKTRKGVIGAGSGRPRAAKIRDKIVQYTLRLAVLGFRTHLATIDQAIEILQEKVRAIEEGQ